jgi:hypothetical protein
VGKKLGTLNSFMLEERLLWLRSALCPRMFGSDAARGVVGEARGLREGNSLVESQGKPVVILRGVKGGRELGLARETRGPCGLLLPTLLPMLLAIMFPIMLPVLLPILPLALPKLLASDGTPSPLGLVSLLCLGRKEGLGADKCPLE